MPVQTGTSPSYLVRNPHSYCFRLKVPPDLQRYVGKKELRYSLKTGYLSEAKFKARIMAGGAQLLFRKVRVLKTMKLTDTQIQEIAVDHLKRWKESFEAVRPSLGDDLDPFLAHLAVKRQIESFEYDRVNLKLDLETGNYKDVVRELPEILDAQGINFDELDQDDPSFAKLCSAVLRAKERAIALYMDKLQGTGPKDDLDAAMDAVAGTPLPAQPSITQPEQTSVSLEQAYQDYWEANSSDWKARTITDYKTIRRHTLKILGTDTQIHTLDYHNVKKFRDDLHSGKTSASGNPLSVDRVNLFVGTLGEVYDLAKAIDRSLDHVNPTEQLALKNKTKSSTKQDQFTVDELGKLFCESKEYKLHKHIKPANFWVPLLLMFMGSRRDEICQLRLKDVFQHDGLWCINLVEDIDAGTSIKGSERLVPLHPFLVEELRFPEFVQKIPKSKVRVFHELPRVNNQYGHGVTRWFREFRNRAGVPAPKGRKTLHSFRHTFVTRCVDLDLPQRKHDYITGHSMGKGESSKTYTKDLNVTRLFEDVISKIDFHELLDLTHLKKSKYAGK